MVSSNEPSSRRGPAMIAPRSSITSPIGFTAAMAPAISPFAARSLAVPMPPFTARSGPSAVPAVAPVPAPTLPSAHTRLAAAAAR